MSLIACEEGLVDMGLEWMNGNESLSIDSAEVHGIDRLGSFTREGIVLPFSNRALTISRVNIEERDVVFTASDGNSFK